VIITDSRIIVTRKTVFLKNESGVIDLTKIQDLSAQAHGLFRNYLNFGDIVITLSASIPPVVIECVPKPHHYVEQANRVKREHIVRRQERRGRPETFRTPREMGADYLQDIQSLISRPPSLS
ncbi:MAG: hypothetical protein V1760_01785, partial [Candidatus Peregrinibacteria bacterium]